MMERIKNVLLELGKGFSFVGNQYKISTENQDNQTIGLLLCKGKDRLSVEWALKGTNAPIGVTSYEVRNELSNEILDKLPTEEDINKHIDIKGNSNTKESN